MSEALKLAAEARDRAGKGASRAIRREGRVPAVIYGNKKEPVQVHVEAKALVKLLQTGHFLSSVVELEVGGKTERTLPRDVQFHPVTDRPIHVDFLRLSKDARVTVAVPVRFTDEEESPGIKRGGVLNIVRHEVELVCPADAIPDEIVASLKGLDVGESLHISAFNLSAKLKPVIDDRDFTVATIVAPSALRSSEDAESAAEGEGEAA
ncbi:50S ribosomal protein L25/general stress protein Ctc [Sphingosinicella microcystinivorans]|uniref:Large ribosomal subunit protein bL25 n=1 Tax=Sphingosinicella microcystinivorans TaxID=335406 RepID=A0AAD1FZP0_SPHMI|nr:50S ribosomal protein L25/general stress protein Ctc [Sphingosinicella microcystinivorans]RKS89034.1 LSU ribosomal protein L25P [Sphingosinicella microcystinivorans]BBE32789.1 50S ribosomal protein L25 [Sphingosinicella microcystinivorans]